MSDILHAFAFNYMIQNATNACLDQADNINYSAAGVTVDHSWQQ